MGIWNNILPRLLSSSRKSLKYYDNSCILSLNCSNFSLTNCMLKEFFNTNKQLLKMAEANCNLLNIIKIVCPSAEELSTIVNNVKCDQCGLVFKNEPRLRLHDLKVHQRKNLDKSVKEFVKYHCPESKCIYSPQSSRFFTTRKYLKQHYLKVHAAKRFQCTQCDKSFSTEAAKAAHLRICGLKFTCVCERKFNTYEALLTHAKRLSHSVDERYKYLLKKQPGKLPQTCTQTIQLLPRKRPISILPYERKTLKIQQLTVPISICDAETQTDDIKRIRKAVTPSKASRRRESRQTQTNSLSKEKKSKSTVETQTTPSAREANKKSVVVRRSKNPTKQCLQLNEDLTSDNLFPSSPLNLQHDVAIQDLWEERTTLGTQTNPDEKLLDVFNDSVTQTTFYEDRTMENVFKIDGMSSTSLPYSRNFYRSGNRSDPMLTEETFNDRFSSIETQTEKPYPQSIFDADGALLSSSNTETQTTEDFDNIEQLLYSNMCTQTCNDILPSELGLSDIQTQTAWPDLDNPSNSEQNDRHGDEKSDISMSACRSWLNIQTSHTETQTDLLSIFDELQ